MSFKERTVSRNLKYDGFVVDLYEDDVILSDGSPTKRVVIEHPGGVTIAMEDEEGKFFMVRQWRYGQGKEMLEFPAGTKEKGEEPIETAKREVAEETGYEAKHIEYIGTEIPTAAYNTEHVELYYATKGKYVGQHLDDSEFLELESYTLDEIEEMIFNHEIEDAKTVMLVYLLRNKKGK